MKATVETPIKYFYSRTMSSTCGRSYLCIVEFLGLHIDSLINTKYSVYLKRKWEKTDNTCLIYKSTCKQADQQTLEERTVIC